MFDQQLLEIRKLIFQQNYDKARELLLSSSSKTEIDLQLLELDARLQGQSGEISKALAMFEDLEAAWPDRPEIFKLHVNFLQECGNIEEALEKSLQMLESFPDCPISYISNADCHELAGQPALAMKTCNRGLERFPDNTGLLEQKTRLEPVCKRLEQSRSAIEIAQEELTVLQAHISTESSFITKFLAYFSGREGVHARQTAFKKNRYGYVPVYEELQPHHIKSHLAGDTTLGIYLVRKNNDSTLMVIDLDVAKPFLNDYINNSARRRTIKAHLVAAAKSILDCAGEAGLRLLLEYSGFKGLHLWAISDFPLPARYWRQVGGWLKEKVSRLPSEIHLEVFPKQDQVEETGLGNLVKLPLGIHKASSQRSLFFDENNFRPWPFQAEALDAYQPISRSEFEEILGRITLTRKISFSDDPSSDKIAQTLPSAKKGQFQDKPDNPFELKIKIPLPDRFSPEIEQVLAWCRPLCEIFTLAVKNNEMPPVSRHVFIYIFSALGEEGKIFIHQVLNQLGGYDPDALNAEIRAVPPTTMSCNKVRKNLSEIAARVGCNCQFRLPEGCYASPVVHAGLFPGSKKMVINPINQPVAISTRELIAGQSASIDKLMREYQNLSDEITRANQRLKLLHRQINQIFDQNGCNEINTSIGKYSRLPEIEDSRGSDK
ncbi:MAG: CRISPR-associated primase-polymerase type A1 [Candidatus Rifleibacteriota bacterium]